MIKLVPTKGKILVADPSMMDTSFTRTVILLTEHNENGSVGFILNRPLGFKIKDIIPELNCNAEVFNGGPVEQDSLYFIHKSPDLIPNSIEIGEGIYWGGDFESIKELLNNGNFNLDNIKFFLGYSGWSSKQLLHELKENSWQITKKNFLINESHNLWRRHMKDLGGKFQIWANAPVDPSMN